MTFTRRRFLATGLAAGMMPAIGRAAAVVSGDVIAPSAGMHRLLPPDYPETELWTYYGQIPATQIRAAQGSRLVRRLENGLPQATTIHWHGVRLDNAMDGVPGLTQEAVAPGQSFDYDVRLPDAGTYWYHAHQDSTQQVARGLYGALIVEEAAPPDVDRDEVLLLDDWRINPDNGQISADFGNFHDLSHAGRMGNFFTANGDYEAAMPARRHERLRLRLINTANARIFTLGVRGMEGWIVALDGMPLEEPQPIPEEFTLGPAQRADLIVDVTEEEGAEAYLVQFAGDGGYAMVSFPVSGTASQTRRPAPDALPPNPLPEIAGLDDAPRARMVMEGGAMRGLPSAVYKGQEMEFRALAQEGQFWSLSGYAGMPEEPFGSYGLGETGRIAFVNETAFPHAMHLHGHHFREVLADGTLGPWRDTLLVGTGETREVAFVADNPGEWLLHCHMLSHAASGMMSRIKVG